MLVQSAYRALRHRGAGLSVAIVVLSGGIVHASPPQRIVSLNVCTDQILIELVDRQRIAAVTNLAFDPDVAAAPEEFAGLAATRGGAEDVLAHDPDLIIAGAYTTPAAVDLLRRLGRRVVVVPLPQSIAEVREVITQIAAAVEAPAAGASVVAELDARLARVAARVPANTARPIALVAEVNNYTAGRGTLVDEALQVAGFSNASDAIGTFANGQIALEQIIAQPPDLIVLAARLGAYTTTAADNIRHPAMQQLLTRIPSLVLPLPLWLCGTQHIATAIEKLAAARAAVTGGRWPRATGSTP